MLTAHIFDPPSSNHEQFGPFLLLNNHHGVAAHNFETLSQILSDPTQSEYNRKPESNIASFVVAVIVRLFDDFAMAFGGQKTKDVGTRTTLVVRVTKSSERLLNLFDRGLRLGNDGKMEIHEESSGEAQNRIACEQQDERR